MRIIKSVSILFVLASFSINVSAQEIRTKPGFLKLKYFQNEEQITKHKFEDILATNKKAFDWWTKGRKQENL